MVKLPLNGLYGGADLRLALIIDELFDSSAGEQLKHALDKHLDNTLI